MRKIFFIFILSMPFFIQSVFSSLAPPNPEVYDVGVGVALDDDSGKKLIAKNRLKVPSLPKYNIKSPNFISSSGKARPLVIMIEFTDVTFDLSASPAHNQIYYEALMFSGLTRSSDSKTISVKNYFDENSGGILILENPNSVNNPTGPVTSIHPMSYYGRDGSGIDDANVSIYKLAQEAVQLLDNGTFDFSPYDLDGDNIIDRVIVVHAGQGQESSTDTDTIWSHHWEISGGQAVTGGFTVTEYSIVSEYSPIGIFAHEFCHGLRPPTDASAPGIPDLYNTDSGETAVGSWCLMDSGSWLGSGWNPAHLSAWCKNYLSWGTVTTLNSSLVDASLYPTSELDNSSSTNEFYKVPILNFDDEYFLLEYRRSTGGLNTYDTALKGEGLLIWHIDDNVIFEKVNGTPRLNSNSINANENHLGVGLKPADKIFSTSTEDKDPFGSIYTKFVPPDSDSYSGESSGVSIVNIANPGASYMSMDVYVVKATAKQKVAKSINYPNPTSGRTSIQMTLTRFLTEGYIRIYTISGELVYEKELSSSADIISSSDYEWKYEILWDGKNMEGVNVASGVYIYVITADDEKSTGKIAIIK